MLDPPFNWNTYHPHVLQSYKDRRPNLQEDEFAAWRAQKRHNIHLDIAELTRLPHQPFHPIWHDLWKMKHKTSMRNPGRSFVEELLLRDIFDAIALYDVYSGSVSVFFTHNGRLPPGTRHTPANFVPRSYITPRFLLNRTSTETPSSEPFSAMLQIFICTFAIPQALAFESTATAEGYLFDLAPSSQLEHPSREWPHVQKYTDSALLRLNGWSPSNIPISINSLLRNMFPSLTCKCGPNGTRQTSPPPDIDDGSEKHDMPSPPLSFQPPLSDKLRSLTITDSSAVSSKKSASSSKISTTSSKKSSVKSLSRQLARAQEELEQLRNEQIRLQAELKALTQQVQCTDMEVEKCRTTIEELQTKLRDKPAQPGPSSEQDVPNPPEDISFGPRTSILFNSWGFDPTVNNLLFQVASYSQTEADWWKYLRIPFCGLSERQYKELFNAMLPVLGLEIQCNVEDDGGATLKVEEESKGRQVDHVTPTAPPAVNPRNLMLDKVSQHNINRAAEEDRAVNEVKEHLSASVKKLAAQFDRTEQHFWSLLHFKVKETSGKRRTSGFNAVIHELALQENKDRVAGAKLSGPELARKIRDEGLYERMSAEEMDRLVEKFEAEKLSKKHEKRLTAPQKVADVSHTLKSVANQLHELHFRCGVHAMLFAVQNNTSFKMEPYCFFTDAESQLYLSGVRGIDVHDFITRYQGWALNKLSGVVETSKQRVNSLKETIRGMINKGLVSITNMPQASMVYSSNYDDRIVMRYGVQLQGWPLSVLKNPSNINTLGELNAVADALKEGRCCWRRLTPQEYIEYKQRLQQEVDAGSRKALKYGGAIGEMTFPGIERPQKRRKTR